VDVGAFGRGAIIVLPVDSTLISGQAHGDEVGLWEGWAGDGRPLLAAGSLALVVAGAFAWFLAVTGQLLPHDMPAEPGGTPGPRVRIGRVALLLTGLGMVVAGVVITTVGTLVVFVPQDLAFIGLGREALDAIDPHLVPLIAHDRAGFGGGLATTGLIVVAVVRFGRPSRGLWQALALAGIAGFGAAVGVHGLVGYLDVTHVGPAILAAGTFAAGMALVRPSMHQRSAPRAAEQLTRTRGPLERRRQQPGDQREVS